MAKRLFLNTSMQGAAAGLAGGLAMLLFRSAWRSWTRNRPADQLFGLDRYADIGAVLVMADMAGVQTLSDEDAERWAIAFHLAFSALGGSVYAMAAGRFPSLRRFAALPFGVAIWLFADEIPVSVGGIDDPLAKSRLGHAGALASHLVYAATVQSLSSERYIDSGTSVSVA